MKNKVLEMQIASAFDRGKNFEDTLKRHGGKTDAKDLLKQLEDKMEHVEGLLLKDEDRQQDMLKMKLEQRRLRRRKLQDKLETVQAVIKNNESQKQELREDVIAELQEELAAEMKEMDVEDIQARKAVDAEFDRKKQDKLSEYEDRLKNAGGKDQFQKVLGEYQLAQAKVEKELERQRQKEDDRLDRELKARRAKAKARAELKRNEKFAKIDEEIEEQL